MQTDYLIIGAGATGLAFADEMLTRSDAHMTIVERRHAPGGHWNDTYPFVRLHQPSVFYGVESTALSEPRIDSDGLNAGYLSLAEGSEVTAVIDWERRYRHMRMHTCMHLLCSLVDAPVTGGNLGAEKGRLDFDLPESTVD
ncbi:MAG: NAD(P)-binding protein, partial [Pseudomonadota bacterium]